MNYFKLQKMRFTHLTQKKSSFIMNPSPPIEKIPATPSIVVKKIVAVYQLKYTNSTVYGFGDFLRGCFCLIRHCKHINLEFDIDLSNHPLSKYVEGHIKNPFINYNNISMLEFSYESSRKLFYTKFKDLIQNVKSEVYYTSSNSYPMFEINKEDIDFIKIKIKPNVEMKQYIEQEITNLNLINCDFSVIHIRVGDIFLFTDNTILNQKLIDLIFHKLNSLLNDKSKKYLILSDSTELKMLFKPYENCIFQVKPITHLGEQLVLKDELVRNTMIDFYLMSYASYIYSYSVLSHGSGFSKWCAVIYNIPYESYII